MVKTLIFNPGSGKPLDEISIVTSHLESGSSATAIRNGRSADNTMGLNPLEGLMMGTRCGSIDPAIVPFLVEKERRHWMQAVRPARHYRRKSGHARARGARR